MSKLNSELGERVVGTAQMAGTEIMTVADLNNMEARVDIGEIDVPLIKLGQKAVLEVDSFKDQKVQRGVTEIANSANNNDTSSAASPPPRPPTRPNSRSESASRRRVASAGDVMSLNPSKEVASVFRERAIFCRECR